MSATEPEPPPRTGLAVAGQLTAVAFEFIGSILAGAVLGYLADRAFGTEPAALIALTLLGTTAGFSRMIQMLRHFQRRTRSR